MSICPVRGVSICKRSVSSGFMKTGSSEQTVLESFRRNKFLLSFEQSSADSYEEAFYCFRSDSEDERTKSCTSCLDSSFDLVVRAKSESFEAMVSFFFIS